ncbi:MAG: Haloacid dehalogenase domain protein hydrolase type 3 [Candidatus Micrarchaeum acidiphilum ARMAN-2]|jgi:HAD superfamily hydrolase (TIGR01484 family)|uniref:Haloacid dehalogenase domain protein hydrolase type 3 n=1 Tax=Candidatus Micrarchaeum acidiphilum ARMAN-2 TaxID=425595 RepID=C7DH10_MICA2|nr:MAG: Haloacid dehalogenase domain protein hydrolase type 3 [Candidatus Micrarchaeum acidiphilum ARMAN-2]
MGRSRPNMAKKTIVFIDIDGTLVNTKNKYHVSEGDAVRIRSEMNKLAKHGFLFGLNSNRSMSDMLPVYRKFGFNGPLVAENGLIAKVSRGRKAIALLGVNDLKAIRNAKLKFQRAVLSYLAGSSGRRVIWLETDTVAALKRQGRFNYPDGTLLILNTKSRVYTTSLYLKLVQHKKLVDAPGIMSGLEVHMKTLFKNKKEFTIVVSQFGNMLFYTSKVSKRTAVKWLKKTTGSCNLYAIGDEDNDYKMVNRIGKFMAVGNASQTLKKKAYAYARHKYSKGVIELLCVLSAKLPKTPWLWR